MRIDKLIVKKTKPTEIIIRVIKFKPTGLSLIVDNTTDVSNESGNNVGKTTVIKIIDLCLGAKSVRELYYDADTKSENADISEFLNINKVQAELTLVKSTGETTVIKRDLFLHGNRYIDDIQLKEDEFGPALKECLFSSYEKSPTFRQLISKFVRVSSASEEGMIRFIPGMPTNETYDTVYSYLFKLLASYLVSQKNDLCIQLADCKRTIAMFEKNKSISSISVLRQKEEIVEKDLKDYTDKREQLSYIEDYKDELESKRKLTSEITKFEENIQLLDFEVATISESLKRLASEKSNIDYSHLEQIYKEAKGYVPQLQKKFKDLVVFHNTMIQNRMDFISKQLEIKQHQLSACSQEIDRLMSEKKRITIEILDEGLLDELNSFNRKIEDLSVQKGEILQSIKLLQEQEQLRNKLERDIQSIDDKLDDTTIDGKMSVFNQIFSEYCDKLYGEKYLIAYNSDWKKEKKFPITVDSLGGNVGTGKKKAIIVAFDLAYLKFAEKLKISAPQFVIHDKLENTHINQLKTIFEICQTINGQYIIPILRERVDKVEAGYIENAKVLELSAEDKFFRI